MDEQPIFKEKIRYLGLYLDVYKFRDYYLTIVKDKLRLDEEPLVFGATIETEDSIKALKKEINMLEEEGFNNTEGDLPPIEFFANREYETGSSRALENRVQHNPMRTYGGYLSLVLDHLTDANNIAFINRMLEIPEFANRYLLHVTRGPLKGCIFDAEAPYLFLGQKVGEQIPNIHKFFYLPKVTIRDDISRMTPRQRDELRMIIATALQKAQKPGATELTTTMRKEIEEFGGKKKRKSLKKKRKSKGGMENPRNPERVPSILYGYTIPSLKKGHIFLFGEDMYEVDEIQDYGSYYIITAYGPGRRLVTFHYNVENEEILGGFDEGRRKSKRKSKRRKSLKKKQRKTKRKTCK